MARIGEREHDLGRDRVLAGRDHGRDEIHGELHVVARVARRVPGEELLQQEGLRSGIDLDAGGLLLAPDLLQNLEEKAEPMLGRLQAGLGSGPAERRHVHHLAERLDPDLVLVDLARVSRHHEDRDGGPQMRRLGPVLHRLQLRLVGDVLRVEVHDGAVMRLLEDVLLEVAVRADEGRFRVDVDVLGEQPHRTAQLVTILVRDDDHAGTTTPYQTQRHRVEEVPHEAVLEGEVDLGGTGGGAGLSLLLHASP